MRIEVPAISSAEELENVEPFRGNIFCGEQRKYRRHMDILGLCRRMVSI